MTRVSPEEDSGGGGKPPSYANMARSPNVSPIIECNVLVIRVKKSQEARERNFEDKICEKLFELIGIYPERDTIGCQYLYEKGDIVIEIWLKEHIQAEKFSSDQQREICPGFTIFSVHPAMSREISLLVLGLPLTIHDNTVREYVEQFGGKFKNIPPVMCKAKNGLWGGQLKSDRRYRVDFGAQLRPMGTYHLIGGK